MVLLADWGSTLQKVLVMATWTGSLLLTAALPVGRSRGLVLAAAVSMVLLAISGGVVVAARDQEPRPHDGLSTVDLSVAIERYATFDTSLTVLMDVFRPMVGDGEFYRPPVARRRCHRRPVVATRSRCASTPSRSHGPRIGRTFSFS